MSYLSLIIALIMTSSTPTNPDRVFLDVYLDHLVTVEEIFLSISWWIFGIAVAIVVIGLILGILSLRDRGEKFFTSIGCGCVLIFFLLLPLFEWLTLILARNMADSVNPAGIVDSGRFFVNAIIYLIIGTG